MENTSITTIRVLKSTREKFNLFNKTYYNLSADALINKILDFIEKYNLDIDGETQTDVINNIQKEVKSIQDVLSKLEKEEHKNTERIIKILVAQQRDILIPIFENKFVDEIKKEVKNEIDNNVFDIEKENKEEEKLHNEIHLLKLKLEKANDENVILQEKYSKNETKFQEVKNLFQLKGWGGNYTATLTKEEYERL